MTTDEFKSISTSSTAVLRDILALDQKEQAKLYQVLRAILGQPAGDAPATKVEQIKDEQVEDPAEIQAEVQLWLDELMESNLSNYQRVAILEEKYSAANSELVNGMLDKALRDILDQHPPIAIRRAVVKLATENIVLCAIGGLGLLLAIGSGLASVVRKIF